MVDADRERSSLALQSVYEKAGRELMVGKIAPLQSKPKNK
jgi:hypothetical protein